MTSAVLALGSNLGDRMAHLHGVFRRLVEAGVLVGAASSVYETPPWGDPDQPTYYNAVLLVEHPDYRAAADWLRLAIALERAAGRERDPVRRYAPRTLDVDVIMMYDEDGVPVESADPAATLPHPRAHLRAFVLVPWLDVEPDAELPGRGPVRELLTRPPVDADVPGIQLADRYPPGRIGP